MYECSEENVLIGAADSSTSEPQRLIGHRKSWRSWKWVKSTCVFCLCLSVPSLPFLPHWIERQEVVVSSFGAVQRQSRFRAILIFTGRYTVENFHLQVGPNSALFHSDSSDPQTPWTLEPQRVVSWPSWTPWTRPRWKWPLATRPHPKLPAVARTTSSWMPWSSSSSWASGPSEIRWVSLWCGANATRQPQPFCSSCWLFSTRCSCTPGFSSSHRQVSFIVHCNIVSCICTNTRVLSETHPKVWSKVWHQGTIETMVNSHRCEAYPFYWAQF